MATLSLRLALASPPTKNPEPNSEPLHHRLITSLNAGQLRRAISTVHLMSSRGSHPDLPTFSLLLKACVRSRSFDLGELVHASLMASDLELDSLALNSLISLYSKNGRWKMAKEIFDQMGEKRNLVSWTSMVSCFANNGMASEAVGTFLDMLDTGFSPNEFCFSAAIRACSDLGDSGFGKAVFGFAVKSGNFTSDLCVGCSLIDMFAKGLGDVEEAYKVFDKMPDRNAVAWTLMITRFVQFGRAKQAAKLFYDVMMSGVEPDKFTFSSVLSACAESKEFSSLGKQLHSLVVRYGLDLDPCVACSLIDMYAKSMDDGRVDEARKVFDQMPSRNVMSWTSLINGYVNVGSRDLEAVHLFREMISGPVRPNHFTFSSVLKASANLSELSTGKQVQAFAIKLGFASDNSVGNAIISMYAQSGKMDDSRRAFDGLLDKNLVSYNTILDGYAKNLDLEEAFNLFLDIDSLGFEASEYTLTSILTGTASVGAISKGEKIHARILKSELFSSQSVNNALISMYSKCGDIEAAFKIFSEMTDRNVISWTAIITGFSKHGFAERALKTFHEMLESGTNPNEITYTAVLSACSHAGFVPEGLQHFHSMRPKHGIIPRTEHYACIVDLFGRSGRLVEAHEFILSMPFSADALIWRTLLGACRLHSHIELGKHAAKMILAQDPRDPAAYVLLANLLASAGQWGDVADLWKEMKERDLVKEAGTSWVEVGSEVHRFHAGDTGHPMSGRIHEELERLMEKIKGQGYVADTDWVLHNVGAEEKERRLRQHSEKIAVAFGLISTTGKKPVRVFKNLRICGDCHAAIKLVSAASGREIVVRDSNRFHHMKDGTCSCGDYW